MATAMGTNGTVIQTAEFRHSSNNRSRPRGTDSKYENNRSEK
jgi:hypothetical protein